MVEISLEGLSFSLDLMENTARAFIVALKVSGTEEIMVLTNTSSLISILLVVRSSRMLIMSSKCLLTLDGSVHHMV